MEDPRFLGCLQQRGQYNPAVKGKSQIECSLVEKITPKGKLPGTIQGNVLTIPGFGKISLAELIVDQFLIPVEHVPAGTGLSDEGRNQRWKWHREWKHRTLTLVALALLTALSGCKSRTDPNQYFASAQKSFLHGDLAAARQSADQAYVAIPDKNSALAWKIQIFKADVLIWQGFNQDVISLLSPPLPAALATNDLAIRRALSLSLAKARLGDFAAALQFINQAEKLASDSSPVLGEVYRIRGVVELERQNIDGAETYIRRSLEISHRSNDVFLEATALLNLGVIASKRNRFDESIDWLSSAREKAKSLDAELLIEKVVGNLAWAYYRMGNFQAAIDSYNQAQISAKDLDIVRDNVRWLNNIGLVYARTSKLAEAQNSYEQSLALAQKIGDPDQELIVLTSLAFFLFSNSISKRQKSTRRKRSTWPTAGTNAKLNSTPYSSKGRLRLR